MTAKEISGYPLKHDSPDLVLLECVWGTDYHLKTNLLLPNYSSVITKETGMNACNLEWV